VGLNSQTTSPAAPATPSSSKPSDFETTFRSVSRFCNLQNASEKKRGNNLQLQSQDCIVKVIALPGTAKESIIDVRSSLQIGEAAHFRFKDKVRKSISYVCDSLIANKKDSTQEKRWKRIYLNKYGKCTAIDQEYFKDNLCKIMEHYCNSLQ